jgi:periplasmic protein CpxP/Spy
MKPNLMTRVAPALLAVTLAFPAIALQTTPASAAETGAAAPGAATENGKPVAGGPVASPMMARVEQRVAILRAQLKITATEEAQWQQFATVMRDNAQKMDQAAAERAKMFRSLNAVENLKSYGAMAVDHGQNVQKLVQAFETLYNIMPPEQKKLADEVFRSREEQRQQRRRG